MRKTFSKTIQIVSVYAGGFGGAVFTGKVLGQKYNIKFKASYKVLTKTPESGEFWSIGGEVTHTEKYGYNVNVTHCRIVPLPAESYLSSLLIKHTKFRGINLGKSKVKKLVEHFGSSELIRLMEADNYLAIADIISLSIAKELCYRWNPLLQEMKLANFLMENNIEPFLAKKIIKICKLNTLERIIKNPYGLLAFGSICKSFWNTIDKTAQKLGFSQDSPERKIGAIEYILYQHLLFGDTAMPEQKLRSQSANLLGDKLSNNAIEMACQAGAICFFIKDDIRYFQTTGTGRIEAQLEGQIRKLIIRRVKNIPKAKELVKFIDYYSENNQLVLGHLLTEEQKSAIKIALTNRVSVIHGYGGTGKTTVLKAIVEIAEQHSRSVYLLTPVKAKERAREAISRDDITFTIHSFIKQLTRVNSAITHHKPLIVIEEASMVDISLANRLLKHLKSIDYSLLLVGDAGQLSPVGFGLFFHECVNRVPTVHLTKVHRQAKNSPIQKLAMLIRNREMSSIPRWNKEDKGVYFVDCHKNLKDLIKRIVEITSTHKGQILSPHGSQAMIDNANSINQSMQYTYNQSDEGLSLRLGSIILKENDPIIVTTNNYELELFNGMTGSILGIELGESKENIVAEFNNRAYTLSKDQCFELGIELAYALSINKSQGSEYDTTIICCIEESRIIERSMIYTALIRSKNLTLFVGDLAVLKSAVMRLPRSETICHGFSLT